MDEGDESRQSQWYGLSYDQYIGGNSAGGVIAYSRDPEKLKVKAQQREGKRVLEWFPLAKGGNGEYANGERYVQYRILPEEEIEFLE